MFPKPFRRLGVGGVVVKLQQIVHERIPFFIVHHAMPTIYQLMSSEYDRTSVSLLNPGRSNMRGGGRVSLLTGAVSVYPSFLEAREYGLFRNTHTVNGSTSLFLFVEGTGWCVGHA